MRRSYDCPACLGGGEATCECCDSDIKCTRCNGTGINRDAVDLDAFEKAESAKRKEHGGGSWSIVEDREVVGRQGGGTLVTPAWKLYYRDCEKINP